MSIFSNLASRAPEEAAAYSAAILDLLGKRDPMTVLRETPAALDRAIAGLSDAQLRRREREGKWSIVHVLQHLPSDGLYRRAVDQFERLYQESAEITRVMAISLHPYITGVAHRIGHLEKLYDHVLARPGVLMWTGGEIYDWYARATGLRDTGHPPSAPRSVRKNRFFEASD